MKQKLNSIFHFLQSHRQYNKALQIRFYKSVIRPELDVREKVIALLHDVMYSQSQPKIDKVAAFFKFIHNYIDSLDSFHEFVGLMSSEDEVSYQALFEGLRSQEGWGDKTSALFVKSIYHLHNGHYPKELRLWDDVPTGITKGDKFYLPVDSVMIAIFNKIDPEENWNFKDINWLIQSKYDVDQIEVWDDLWFWGFITQIGTGDNRIHVWNENKYWALLNTDKNLKTISEIESLAIKFLKILSE
jgi:hypothetical protein